MSRPPTLRGPSRPFLRWSLAPLLTLALVAASGWACERGDAAEPTGEPLANDHLAQGPETAGAESPEVTTGPNYAIAHPATRVAVAEPGSIELRVTPSPGFKVNTEYPWELTLQASEAVDLAQTELDRDGAAELTDDVALYQVPVTVDAAGRHDVEGHLRFSICNDSRCDVLQAEIAWAVTAE